MKKARSVQQGKAALELLEEAFHLLRLAGTGTLAAYYLGSIPFILGVLFFWSDMSRSPFAEARVSVGAFGLVLLFVWMKTWQSVFARQLWAQVQERPTAPWTVCRVARLALNQLVLQPLGLFLLPLGLLIFAPYAWIYAFYQNVTVLGGGEGDSVKNVYQKSWRQALLWPGQNHTLLALTHGFGFFVLINVISGFVLCVYLLSSLLGIETPFSQSPWSYFNTTFFAAVLGVSYLCLDPVIKTAYVLRCFYGASLHSGEDLRSDLRRLKAGKGLSLAALIVALIAWNGVVAQAEESPQSPAPSAKGQALRAAELDKTIGEVIQKTEYTWRFPREHKEKPAESKSVFKDLLDGLIKSLVTGAKVVKGWFDQLWKWLTRGKPANVNLPGSTKSWWYAVNALLIALVLACTFLLVWLAIKIWKHYRASENEIVSAAPIQSIPDLNDESVAADQLPEEGWSRMARELLERGEWRLALRALYLASLAYLAERNLVTIARSKSNQDYLRELDRRAHALPEVAQLFSENVSTFDCVWYGLHAVDHQTVDAFAGNVERMKAHA
jgi:hypothetical protein